MNKVVLITANGDGTRMKKYFTLPKHHLYYNGKMIIDMIVSNCLDSKTDYCIASKIEEKYSYNVIQCDSTSNRMETIKHCISKLSKYKTIIVHDCDVLFPDYIINQMQEDSITVSFYKKDGLKYGFVSVDSNLEYKEGNEKKKESGFITTGLYSFDIQKMEKFLINNPKAESMLDYYNKNKPKLIYTESHINLGDINSYFDNI